VKSGLPASFGGGFAGFTGFAAGASAPVGWAYTLVAASREAASKAAASMSGLERRSLDTFVSRCVLRIVSTLY
jgi:hypothetical protein